MAPSSLGPPTGFAHHDERGRFVRFGADSSVQQADRGGVSRTENHNSNSSNNDMRRRSLFSRIFDISSKCVVGAAIGYAASSVVNGGVVGNAIKSVALPLFAKVSPYLPMFAVPIAFAAYAAFGTIVSCVVNSKTMIEGLHASDATLKEQLWRSLKAVISSTVAGASVGAGVGLLGAGVGSIPGSVLGAGAGFVVGLLEVCVLLKNVQSSRER